MVKVSVIVPVYNAEKYLDTCIKSILNQTLREIEVLLINDGSTDNSLEICNSYIEKDTRIKVYTIPNSGAATARNIGLKYAVGEFIGFVDSDDWVEDNMYKKLYDLAISKKADIVSLNFVQDYLNKSHINKIDYEDGCYSEEDLINKIYPNLICNAQLENNVPYTMVTKIFKRSILHENSIYFYEPLLGGQDMAFSIECFLHCKKFHLSKYDYSYHYVYNKNSRTNTYLKNAWDVYIAANSYFQKITNEYEKYNFSNQIEYDLLRGAMSAINYELKPGNKKSILQKIEKVREIYTNEKLKNVYELVNSGDLSLSRKVLLVLMKNDKALAIYFLSVIRNLIRRIRWGIK